MTVLWIEILHFVQNDIVAVCVILSVAKYLCCVRIEILHFVQNDIVEGLPEK